MVQEQSPLRLTSAGAFPAPHPTRRAQPREQEDSIRLDLSTWYGRMHTDQRRFRSDAPTPGKVRDEIVPYYAHALRHLKLQPFLPPNSRPTPCRAIYAYLRLRVLERVPNALRRGTTTY